MTLAICSLWGTSRDQLRSEGSSAESDLGLIVNGDVQISHVDLRSDAEDIFP
jgi:hypothetical protein